MGEGEGGFPHSLLVKLKLLWGGVGGGRRGCASLTFSEVEVDCAVGKGKGGLPHSLLVKFKLLWGGVGGGLRGCQSLTFSEVDVAVGRGSGRAKGVFLTHF